MSNNKALYGILGLVVVFFGMLLAFAFLTMKSLTSLTDMDLINDSVLSSSGSIAVVEINGTIMKSKKVIKRLRKAEELSSTKAIIARINSPGGAVGPSQEIYEELVRIDKKIPVYASFGSIAASGGYYIGSAARKIFSNKGTLTGSIGVIMQFADLSKLYEFARVRPQTIKAGKYKDIGNPSRSLNEEEKDLMDNLITGVHKQFMDDIIARRKDRLKVDISELAQGQIFSGEQAKDYGLVDEIGSLWTAGAKIHEELKLEGEFKKFHFIKEKKKVNFFELAQQLDESISHIGAVVNSLITGTTLMFR